MSVTCRLNWPFRQVYNIQAQKFNDFLWDLSEIFVCVLSLLISRIIEKELIESRLTIEWTGEMMDEIEAIHIKSPSGIAYRSECDEAVKILKELKMKNPDRILIGPLPTQDKK